MADEKTTKEQQELERRERSAKAQEAYEKEQRDRHVKAEKAAGTKGATLVKAMTDYVNEVSAFPDLRRVALGAMTPEDRAAFELFMEWFDPDDIPPRM